MSLSQGYGANPYPAPINLSYLEPDRGSEHRMQRFAFLGRVSTRERQDPDSSISGQLARASTTLPPNTQFCAWYWDIESGALDLHERGRGDYADIEVDIPRTGGVADCLQGARTGAFDVVVVDEVSRPARSMVASMVLEQQLREAGVAYRIASEPAQMHTGARSTQYILRRTTQVTAGWYRLMMFELCERGQREHARRGFLHGVAPYGFIAVPADAAPPKNTDFMRRRPRVLALDPDERKPAAVQAIFRWRVIDRLGYRAIAYRLNADLDTYPPPQAARWNPHAVRRLLRNPKYSGWMAWNRKGSRTDNHRPKPLSEWVWSSRPCHPAIVSLQTWVRAQEVTAGVHCGHTAALEHLHAAAANRGLAVQHLRSSAHHGLYRIGKALIPVPTHRGGLPDPLVQRILQEVEQL